MTTQGSDPRVWVLKANTAIWTGDADREGEHTIPTGLLGSLRWWFEVVVRGLNGCACDPTDSVGRCPDKINKRCAVCELFGCTGWARKFRFDVLDESGKIKRGQIKKDETFRFRFTPLRPMREEEWALLDLTLRLIADYGAIGGKTVLKPSDEKDREKELHHQDYGLIAIAQRPINRPMTKEALQRYVVSDWRSLDHGDFGWASVENFWCVGSRFVTRNSATSSTFNSVLGRDQRKTCIDCGNIHNAPAKCPETRKHPRRHSDRSPSAQPERWLAGGRAESKKVFSFKDPARTFGFVKPGLLTLDDMRKRLKYVWQDLKNEEFLTGPTILDRLLVEAMGGVR
ncbi:type III-B CRISPR module RAMP protein Cmr1 [Pseudacidobacterium ailaaui]|jgi:CRISPR-associated protein Cmr1|uniref:type III-B CRISPR module RAMP protein Cmr1 n=1 Tax=Pseudacidobacterium ailaaui TaxID=1382359 RepID=UPI00047AA8F4|nr:type III-B CRISPR module RAMP protein Cmr1 [Pseudacidobacterium ailaaui]